MSNPWDFSTPIWYERFSCTDYPTFEPCGSDGIDGTELDENGNPLFCPFVSLGQVRKMVNTISGLDHLEGEQVSIQADGILGNPITATVSGGAITLTDKAAVVHAGLPYTGRIKLLKASDGMPPGSTGQMKMRRIYLAGIRVFRSLGFKIGLDEDNLSPVIYDTPALPLVTGDLKKFPNTTWSKKAQLNIIQDQPLPLFLLAIVSKSEVENI